MKKILFVLFALGLLLGSPDHGSASSTQVDALIEKLVDKGILTKAESIELKAEIASDEKLMREEGLKQGLPKWVQDLKLKGDFRLRAQWERRQHAEEERWRGRIRYRLGIESKLSDSVKVAAGCC